MFFKHFFFIFTCTVYNFQLIKENPKISVQYKLILFCSVGKQRMDGQYGCKAGLTQRLYFYIWLIKLFTLLQTPPTQANGNKSESKRQSSDGEERRKR